MATVPEDARTVPIVDLPLVVVTTTGVFLVLALLGVGIRTYVGYRRKLFGLDDGMVLFSALSFIAVFGLTWRGASVGVGTVNSQLNAWMNVESAKWYLIWILVYLTGMVVLKTAVCMTLLRILSMDQRKMRISVWSLVTLCWAAWCVSFFGVLLLCRPIQASWDKTLVAEGKATCGSQSVMVGISQVVTVASVITDVGCTVLPGILMWNTQLHKTSKLEVFALLSIASVASVATIARAPYLSHYADPTNDLMYYCGYMVIFSNIETGIGCFASSLPAIRRLYLMTFKPEHYTDKPSEGHSDGLVTFGGTGAPSQSLKSTHHHNVFTNPTERGISEAHVLHEGSWERLTDEGSDKGILVDPEPSGRGAKSKSVKNSETGIRVDHTYAVEMHPVEAQHL